MKIQPGKIKSDIRTVELHSKSLKLLKKYYVHGFFRFLLFFFSITKTGVVYVCFEVHRNEFVFSDLSS